MFNWLTNALFLKDVNAETINDWINKITFETSGYNLEFTDIQIGYLINEYNGIIDPKHLDEPITSDDVVITLSDKILVLKEEKNCIELKLSFNELFFCINAVNNNMIYEGVTPNTTKIMKNINLYFYNDKQLLFIEKNDNLHRIAYLISSGYYWIENKKVPIEKSVKYYNEKNLIAERVDFAITVNNKNLVLAVQNDIEKNKQNAIIFVTD